MISPVWDRLRCTCVALDRGVAGDILYIRHLRPGTHSRVALWSPPVLRRTANRSPKAVIRGRAHGSGNPSPFSPSWGVTRTSMPLRAYCFKAFSVYVRCTLHWVGGFGEERLGHLWYPSFFGAPLQLQILSSHAGCLAFFISLGFLTLRVSLGSGPFICLISILLVT